MTIRTALPPMTKGTNTLGDSVYMMMTDLIADGTWAPRSKLPSEAELSHQFGVSRPIVRQALAKLRETGLVASRKGSGSFVQDVQGVASAPQQFPAIESIAVMERFLDFREGVEGESAAAAARYRTEASLAELTRVCELPLQNVSDDYEFHLAVARASENSFYANTLISLKDQLLFCLNLARSFAKQQEPHAAMVREQHRAIAQAIGARDAEKARELMHAHLRWSRTRAFTRQSGS